jgi:hypothetical protein
MLVGWVGRTSTVAVAAIGTNDVLVAWGMGSVGVAVLDAMVDVASAVVDVGGAMAVTGTNDVLVAWGM